MYIFKVNNWCFDICIHQEIISTNMLINTFITHPNRIFKQRTHLFTGRQFLIEVKRTFFQMRIIMEWAASEHTEFSNCRGFRAKAKPRLSEVTLKSDVCLPLVILHNLRSWASFFSSVNWLTVIYPIKSLERFFFKCKACILAIQTTSILIIL